MTQSSSSSDSSDNNANSSENNAMLLTSLGAVLAVALSGMGAATGSVAGAQYAMSASHGNVLSSFVPIVIAGVLAIYGLIVAVILCQRLHEYDDHVAAAAHHGQAHLAAGLAVGLSCLASGNAMSSFCYFLLWNGNDPDAARNGNSSSNKQQVAPERQALLVDDKSSQADAVIRKVQPMTIKAVMMFVFMEALGLYGLIVALLLIGK